jgi:hypothetical protein
VFSGVERGDSVTSSTLSLTWELDGGGWLTPHPSRFTPGKDPVPIVQEAGRAPAPGRVWMGAENLAPTENRSPDRPLRRQSRYRLSYHGPQYGYVCCSTE